MDSHSLAMSIASLERARDFLAAAEAFMLGADDVCPNWMTSLAGMWKKLNWSTTPPVERMRELKAWFDGGYKDILKKWEGRERR